MRVLIIGGAGFLGQSLAHALSARGTLRGGAITQIGLADIRDAAPVTGKVPCNAKLLDVSDRDAVELHLSEGWDAVFHLATLATAPAEANFVLGMRSNFFGIFNVLEVCRGLASPVPLVYGSWSGLVDADTMPKASHGAQSAIAETLMHDYTRRGMVDGRILRLPHVVARDDDARHDIFAFLSEMIRAPFAGEPAMSKVAEETSLNLCSAASAVENLIRMAELEAEPGGAKVLDAPAVTTTAGALIEAVGAAGPEGARDLIDSDPEDAIGLLASSLGDASKARQKRGAAAGLVGDKTLKALIAACV